MNTPHSLTRTSRLFAGALMLAAFGFTKLAAQPTAPATTTTYNGGAFAVNLYGATLGDVVIADTGNLAPTGGEIESSYGAFSSSSLTIKKAASYAFGGDNVSFAGTVLDGFSLRFVGQSGAAYTLTSSTIASCAWAAANGVNNGFGLCLDLELNGKPIVVTGAPNQTLTIDGWTLILNEHVPASAGATTSIQINAMHLTGYLDWDFICASSATVVSAKAGAELPAFTGVPLAPCAWLLDNCATLFYRCWGSM